MTYKSVLQMIRSSEYTFVGFSILYTFLYPNSYYLTR